MATASAPVVPDGWQAVRLGDVAEVVGGTTPSRANELYWGGDVPWVVPSELTGLQGRYLDASREFITKQGLNPRPPRRPPALPHPCRGALLQRPRALAHLRRERPPRPPDPSRRRRAARGDLHRRRPCAAHRPHARRTLPTAHGLRRQAPQLGALSHRHDAAHARRLRLAAPRALPHPRLRRPARLRGRGEEHRRRALQRSPPRSASSAWARVRARARGRAPRSGVG